MRKLLYLIPIFFVFQTFAQTTIINKYAAVINYDPCLNRIVVDTSTDFNVGDTILIIQMKGAVIDTTNTPSFGNILTYNNAGNHELNIISGKSGNILTLTYVLQNSYDVPNGKVQIVRVPYYQSYTINQTHTCLPWNGIKGGVFAINVANNLTLNKDIDVSGKGFTGGIPFSGAYSCNKTDYYYPSTNNYGGMKGEGITEISIQKMYGRGALANGGGGGNDHNSGGAGGSNAGLGGLGGNQHQYGGCTTPIILNIGGLGGNVLSYNNILNKVFLGGGGGAGHGNDNGEKGGGNGGGIVIISAGNIIANNHTINANGANAPQCNAPGPTCQDDGGGGGGGGGSILLKTSSITGSLNTTVNGGKGSDIYSSITSSLVYQDGPGGGGGAGAIWLSNISLQTNMVTSTLGGNSGILPQFSNNNYGALPGLSGQILDSLKYPFPSVLYTGGQFNLNFSDTTIDCYTRKFNNLTLANNVASWLWNFGNGDTSTLKNPTYTFPGPGTYNVKLTAINSNGCIDSFSKTIIIGSFNYSIVDSAYKCTGIKLTAINNGSQVASQFLWNFGDSTSATGNPVTHIYSTAGSYLVTLILSDSLGCTDTSSYGVPISTFNALFTVNKDTICQGDDVTFINNSSNSASVFAWNFADGSNEDSTINTSHFFLHPGSYPVRLIVANADLCVDTAYKTIIVDSLTGVNFYLTDSNLCEGKQIIFNVIVDTMTATGLQWNFSDGYSSLNAPSLSHSFDTAGVFTVTIKAHFRSCPDATTSNNVTVYPYPRLDLGPDTSMCPNGDAILLADNINAFNPNAKWQWNNGEITSSILVRHPGIYTASVTIDGCATNDSVEIFKDCYIDIPNAFSPNNDGINDYFIPRQLLSKGVTDFKMTIFNRWGEVIFETDKIDGRGWDGKFNGVDQPQGVYIYLIEATLKNKAVEKYQGNVTLLR